MAALNRSTTCANVVNRLAHKIALEEAILPVSIPLNETTPHVPQVADVPGAVLSPSFTSDVGQRLTDVSLRLQSMDASGIRYAIVSLTSPGIEGVFDAKQAVEYARKVNDGMYATYVVPYPTRFGFFACLPMQDPPAAARELERCVTQLGAKGALVNGYVQLGRADSVRYLDEAECEPVWAALATLDVPLYLHPRVPPPSQQRVYRGFPMLAHAAYGFGAETGAHALRLACSGLFDRYPRLQVVLGHAAEALPFLAHRIDHRLAVGVPGASGPHKQSVSYYLRNNFLATLSGVRRLSTVRCALEEMGEERVLWSVDYPYESNEDAADWFDGVEGLGKRRRERLRGGMLKGYLAYPLVVCDVLVERPGLKLFSVVFLSDECLVDPVTPDGQSNPLANFTAYSQGPETCLSVFEGTHLQTSLATTKAAAPQGMREMV